MGLEHFIGRERSVTVGGLRFVCRGPSVATIHLVLGLYGAEIVTARRTMPEGADAELLISEAVKALAAQKDPRVLNVLETCVDGPLGEIADHRVTLAQECLEMCDLNRIMEGLPIDEAPDETDGDGEAGVSFQSRIVMRLARDHGCSPLDVMRWPYEAFLEALDVLQAEMMDATSPDQPSDPTTLPGMGVSNARAH